MTFGVITAAPRRDEVAAWVNRKLGFVPLQSGDSHSREGKGFPEEESAPPGRRRLGSGIIFCLEAPDCCLLVETPRILRVSMATAAQWRRVFRSGRHEDEREATTLS